MSFKEEEVPIERFPSVGLSDGTNEIQNISCPKPNKLKPSFYSVLGYIFLWPLWLGFFFIPGKSGDGDLNCLPVSPIAIVSASLCALHASKIYCRYLAKGLFHPLWGDLNDRHRETIIWELADFVIRTILLGIILWYIFSQGQSLIDSTISIVTENCSQQIVSFYIAVNQFYAMMVYELFTKKVSTQLKIHHVVVILSILVLGMDSIRDKVINNYYVTIMAWIILGGQLMFVTFPGYVYYHLYPSSPFDQLVACLYLMVVKTINVSISFFVMPYWILWSNYQKMSVTSFWCVFWFTSLNFGAECSMLWRRTRIIRKKYLEWEVAKRKAKQVFKEQV